MADSDRHFSRLAAAQSVLARLKETQLSSEEKRLSGLLRDRSELRGAVERTTPSILNYPSVVLRLSGLETAIEDCERRLEELRREAIKARIRQDALSRHAGNLRSKRIRKDVEVEMQEVVVAMRKNAPHKDPMLD